MMNFFSTTEIILLLMVFVIRTSMGISIHQYKRLEYMNDKISSEQNSLFTRKGSLIECIKECASIPNCVSVFHSKLFCKGYSVVYHPSSPNLISMQGIRYYACVYSNPGFCMTNSTDVFLPDSTTQIITDNSSQKTIITDATTQESSPETTSLSFSTADTSSPLYSTILTSTTSLQSSCSILGYSWDSSYNICYRFYITELDAVESKAKCQSDDPNSRLLLVDSDNTYNFAVHIVVTTSIESIYLQGIRSGSAFVDDHGQLITYFRWNVGEPGSGEHLQTERDTRLQEASSGGTPFPVLCRFYG